MTQASAAPSLTLPRKAEERTGSAIDKLPDTAAPSSPPSLLAEEGREGALAWVEQTSHLTRIGLKGPHAAAWLQQRDFLIPERANSWVAITPDEQDIVVRLGTTEFFIESQRDAQLQSLANELAAPLPGVYPVMREDRAFVLGGPAADAVLAEMCNVNFSALRDAAREAVMTMMVGVAVVVVPQGSAARRRYRIWCDPSYGDYLWSSLRDVASTHESGEPE